MVYYPEENYKLLTIKKSDNPKKKYMAILQNKKSGRNVKVHFGAINFSQYKDSTGLGIYSHLDHNDKKRRDRYYKRHSNEKFKKYSPSYFSGKYLW